MTTNKVVLYALLAFFLAGVGYAIFGGDELDRPDADQQEEALTKCLREGGFAVESEIPPAGIGNQNPEYELQVREDGDLVAYIYLYDFPESVDSFLEDARLDAETEDRKSTLRKRGTAAVDLDRDADTTPAIHRCIDDSQEKNET